MPAALRRDVYIERAMPCCHMPCHAMICCQRARMPMRYMRAPAIIIFTLPLFIDFRFDFLIVFALIFSLLLRLIIFSPLFFFAAITLMPAILLLCCH